MTDYTKLSVDINNWIKYNESINKINMHLKSIKDDKNKLEFSIIKSLETNNLTNKKFKIENNHIFYNTTSTLPSLSIKLLENVLDEFLSTEIKNKILEKIKLYRENNKSDSISLKKRNINRKKSNKSNKSKLR